MILWNCVMLMHRCPPYYTSTHSKTFCLPPHKAAFCGIWSCFQTTEGWKQQLQLSTCGARPFYQKYIYIKIHTPIKPPARLHHSCVNHEYNPLRNMAGIGNCHLGLDVFDTWYSVSKIWIHEALCQKGPIIGGGGGRLETVPIHSYTIQKKMYFQ